MALKDYIVHEVALDCEEGLLSRREALRRLGLMGVTGAAAMALLAACGDDGPAPTAAPASSSPGTVSSDVPTPAAAPTGEEIRFPGPIGELIGVVAEASAPSGAVLVIHENRGLL